MTKNTAIPAIRFKGFTAPWEQRKLGEILQTIPFKPFLKEPKLEGKYEVLQQGNDPIIGFADGSPCSDYEDTVIFGDHTLSLYKPQRPFFIATDGVRIVKGLQPTDGGYLLSLLERYKPQSEGYKRYYGILSDTECMTTYNTNEQKQIGSCFTTLDKLITLHQRKSEKLLTIKKSMLEKMFPKKGSCYPEIRFKGFTAPWEQRKAKELCSIGTGKSNTQDRIDNGKYPFYIRSDVPVRSDKYLYDCEAVITIGDGNIGRVFHYVNGKFDLHQRCYKMTNFQGILGKYFFYYFSNKFYERAMSMTAKATVDSVRLEMISEMDIQKPSQIAEQKQIAEFFSNLDALITLHQRKLKKLHNIKKSMLEKMFV